MSEVLSIAEAVPGNDEVVKYSSIPASAVEITVMAFEADSKPNDNSYCVVEWGDDSGGWECFWGIWGSQPMNHSEKRVGNGVKKVRLRAINNEVLATMMSCRVEVL